MIAEFSVVPLDKGTHLAEFVAGIVDIVDHSGLPYRLTAMGTIVEGDWDDVLSLIKTCHLKMRTEAARVLTRILIDDSREPGDRIERKTKRIEEILNRSIKK